MCTCHVMDPPYSLICYKKHIVKFLYSNIPLFHVPDSSSSSSSSASSSSDCSSDLNNSSGLEGVGFDLDTSQESAEIEMEKAKGGRTR
jgi:hypothetical protein